MSNNFAITGVAGFVAPRHLKAISETGGRLIAATDPHDAVGILDRHSLDVRFFREFERFDRHLEKLRRGEPADRLHYLSICSPNYLHDAHVRLALRLGAHAICEKPLVINPWNLDALQELEHESGCRVNTVLQLRLHPALRQLKAELDADRSAGTCRVCLTYVTARGRWYDVSWKGSADRSGGIATNIGIHLFDLLGWLFGAVERCEVHLSETRRMAGKLWLERAHVTWFLSTNHSDLPYAFVPGRPSTFRSITVDGNEIGFSEGFTDLHTRVYEEVLAARGFGIDDARHSIVLTHRIRYTPVTQPGVDAHPLLTGGVVPGV